MKKIHIFLFIVAVTTLHGFTCLQAIRPLGIPIDDDPNRMHTEEVAEVEPIELEFATEAVLNAFKAALLARINRSLYSQPNPELIAQEWQEIENVRKLKELNRISAERYLQGKRQPPRERATIEKLRKKLPFDENMPEASNEKEEEKR
jgi:hypothetical protein